MTGCQLAVIDNYISNTLIDDRLDNDKNSVWLLYPTSDHMLQPYLGCGNIKYLSAYVP